MNKYTEKFFEGADFKKEFKALIPEYYPVKYKKYVLQEAGLLKKAVKGASKILEAGVGIGRLIPILSPLVNEFVGIDNADLMIRQARTIAIKFPNTKILRGNLESMSTLFSKNYFDFSLCVWNTLGNVKDEVKVLKELAGITKKNIIITVYKKGTSKDRENWYKTVGIRIKRIDRKNEIFYSESGLKSKSYNVNGIKKLAKLAGLKIKKLKDLNGVILYVELSAI